MEAETAMPKFSPGFWMLLALDTEVGTPISTIAQPLPVYLPSFPAWFCSPCVPSHGRARNVCGQGLRLPGWAPGDQSLS